MYIFPRPGLGGRGGGVQYKKTAVYNRGQKHGCNTQHSIWYQLKRAGAWDNKVPVVSEGGKRWGAQSTFQSLDAQFIAASPMHALTK